MRPNLGRRADFIAGLATRRSTRPAFFDSPKRSHRATTRRQGASIVITNDRTPELSPFVRQMREGRWCAATLLTRAVALIHR